MVSQPIKLALVALCGIAAAVPAPAPAVVDIDERQLLVQPYVPIPTTCPSTALVRPATSISLNEAGYVSARKKKADKALAAWLKKQGNFSNSSQPTVGFTSSGGGYRALLCTAGVVQALDGRDSNFTTSGLYQALTYEAGLSGGSWFLSSLAGNNWPTVSYLRDNLWEQAFQNSLLVPANLLSISGLTEYAAVTTELAAKEAAGYPATIVDPYGRLLSYQLLQGADGGVATRLSGLTKLSNFTSHNVPYPIITTTGVNGTGAQCVPPFSALIYEFHPYEYGSWDTGIAAFSQTAYMGTKLTNGEPTISGACTAHYDNLGYIFGTSSDVFYDVCAVIEPSNSSSSGLQNVLEGIVNDVHEPDFQDLFGVYVNPFYKYPGSPMVKDEEVLTMVDGGATDQNNPIWPFIQPAGRSVDVLIVNDNSADNTDNFPNGTEIIQTYQNAEAAGLTLMPTIPPVDTFVSQGLNKRATFFGCNETDTVFIVYLPNVNYTYDSNKPTSKVQYAVAETDAMILNGNAIATQNGTAGWPFCLGCAIKHKDGSGLPEGCDACFEEYCYFQSDTT